MFGIYAKHQIQRIYVPEWSCSLCWSFSLWNYGKLWNWIPQNGNHLKLAAEKWIQYLCVGWVSLNWRGDAEETVMCSLLMCRQCWNQCDESIATFCRKTSIRMRSCFEQCINSNSNAIWSRTHCLWPVEMGNRNVVAGVMTQIGICEKHSTAWHSRTLNDFVSQVVRQWIPTFFLGLSPAIVGVVERYRNIKIEMQKHRIARMRENNAKCDAMKVTECRWLFNSIVAHTQP